MTIATLGDPVRHFWMTRSVARAMGMSLNTAMNEGVLSAEDYARMITRCRMCQQVSDCEAWLGQQCEPAKGAPQGCSNAGAYDRLSRMQPLQACP